MKKIAQVVLVLCLLGVLTACQPKKDLDLNALQISTFYLGTKESPAKAEWITVNDAEIQQLRDALGISQWVKATVTVEQPASSQALLKDKDGKVYRIYDIDDDLIIQADGSKVLYQAPGTATQVMSLLETLKKAVVVRQLIEGVYLRQADVNINLTHTIDWPYALFDLTLTQSNEIKDLMDFETWKFVEAKEVVETTDHEALIVLPAGEPTLFLHSDGTQASLIYQKVSSPIMTITYEIPMIVYASVLDALKDMRLVAYPEPSDQIKNAVYSQATFSLIWNESIPEYLKNATTFSLTSAQSALAKPSLKTELWVRKSMASTTTFDDTYLTLTDTDGYVTTIGHIKNEASAFARITSSIDPSFIEWYAIPVNLTTLAMAFAPAWTVASPNAALVAYSPVKLGLLLMDNDGEDYQESHDLSSDLQSSIKALLETETWRIYPYQDIIFAPGYQYKFTDNEGHVIYISDYSGLNPELDMTTIRVVDLNPDGAKDLYYMAPRSIIQDLEALIEPIYPRH